MEKFNKVIFGWRVNAFWYSEGCSEWSFYRYRIATGFALGLGRLQILCYRTNA